MHTNELLEEIWAIREELAREADYDIGKHFAQLREFTAKNPPPPRVHRTPEQWRRFLDELDMPSKPTADEAQKRAVV